MSDARTYTLNFVGDVMLGRLIDQMFPRHVHEPEKQRVVQADLNLIDLETSAPTHAVKWPGWVFNHRMHPANISALQVAKAHYAELANNHTPDFSELGLLETVKTVKDAGIAFAGAGESREEATRPAILRPPADDGKWEFEVHVWAAADHTSDRTTVANFHLIIDYTQATKQRLKALLNAASSTQAVLKTFSVHWGPNYFWQFSQDIKDLAPFFC